MNSDLEELEAKIKKAKGEDPATLQKKQAAKVDTESRQGVQAGLELVAAIGVSTAMGYGLDQWLETKPLFLIIFLLLGIATGFYNVYRISQNLGTAVGVKPDDSLLHEDKKDAK